MNESFDHERLDVYRVALEFTRWSSDLMNVIHDKKDIRSAKYAEPFDHLDRGCLSILFNTAEGNGRRRMKMRAKFFDDARGSATECAACLDALVAKRVCAEEEIRDGKVMLIRVVSMLTKLVERFSTEGNVREDAAEYMTEPPKLLDRAKANDSGE